MKKFSSLKQVLLLVAVVLIGMANLNAQTVIKVGSIADSIAGTVDAALIKSAYNIKIPADITGLGAYVIEIQGSYDPTLESYPIIFAAKTGASAVNSITVKPATGVKKILSNPAATIVKTGLITTAASTIDVVDATGITFGMTIFGTSTNTTAAFPTVTDITGSVITAGTTNFIAKTGASLYFGPKGTKTIVFSGAAYVTIDGVSRTGETGLTIQNPNNIVARTLSFEGATYCTVKNCYIKGANISGDLNNDGKCGQVYFSGVSNYNVIENNDVCDIDGSIMPVNMFIFYNTGSTTDAAVINTVQNNNIYNFGSTTATPVGNCGCFNFPSSASPNTWILNNRIYWTKTIPAMSTAGNTTFFVIGFGGSSAGKLSRIEGNYIGGTSSDVTGTAVFTPGTTTAITFINGQSNFTVKNNTIFGISSSIPNGVSGIVIGSSYPNADAGEITGNIIRDISVTGAANNAVINAITRTAAAATPSRNVTNNSIYNLSVISTTATNRMLIRGIYMLGICTSNSNFSGNKIYNFTAGNENSTANNFAIGMDLQLYTSVVEKNLIYNLNVMGTAAILTRQAFGIRTTGSNNAAYNGVNGIVIKNNIVRLGTDMTDSPAMICGIYQAAATTSGDPYKIYNNTIYIGGSANSSATIATSTYALYRTGTVPANDIQNNIFSNQRTINGGAANHYAFSVAAPADVATMTKNLYQYNGMLGAIATGSVTTYADLAAWNAARTTASLSSDASMENVAPGFVDATATTPDMHISTSNSPANQSGVAISAVTDDFAGALRADYTPTDMGAYVIAGSTAVENKEQSKLMIYPTTNALVFENLSGNSAHIYSLTGQLVKFLTLTSDKESVSSANGLYIVQVNDQNVKVLVK